MESSLVVRWQSGTEAKRSSAKQNGAIRKTKPTPSPSREGNLKESPQRILGIMWFVPL